MSSRAFSVYTVGDLVNLSAKGKTGNRVPVQIEQKWGQLDPLTALMIYQKCPPVFSIISSRANKVSSIEWQIIPQKKEEDKIADSLKSAKEKFLEIGLDNAYDLGRKIKIFQEIKNYLYDCKPDLSNFDASLRRWAKSIKQEVYDKCQEIEYFFKQPSPGVLWNDFAKQITQDLHVQGRLAILKQKEGLKVGSIFVMPGGSVVPVRGESIGSHHGFIQFVMGGSFEPQLFYRDEIAFAEYLSNSSTAYGMNPLDALINLVSENLLFTEYMANQADGSQTPSKLIVFGDKDSGYDYDPADMKFENPIEKDEQRRIENKLNRKKKDNGIATLTGYGTPVAVDLSKADILPSQIERQNQIDRYVAMVFNASNMEINQTGGDGTSGRSTSEVQERNDNSKGIRPTLKIIEELFTHEVIPYRFGFGYQFQFEESLSEEQKIDLIKKKKDTGVYSVNEIRLADNLDPINDPSFDIPQGASQQEQSTQLLNDIKGSLR